MSNFTEKSNDIGVVGTSRQCYLCAEIKPINAFAKKRDGRDSRCKKCKNQKRREVYRQKRVAKRRYSLGKIQRTVDVMVKKPASQTQAEMKIVESIFLRLATDLFSERFQHEAS